MWIVTKCAMNGTPTVLREQRERHTLTVCRTNIVAIQDMLYFFRQASEFLHSIGLANIARGQTLKCRRVNGFESADGFADPIEFTL